MLGGQTGHNSDTIGTAHLRAFIERVERIEADIAERNADKSEVYKEMRGVGFDVKTVRKIVAKRKLDTADREEQDAIFDLYWTALYGGGESPSRVHVHEGQKSEPAPVVGPSSSAAHGADESAAPIPQSDGGAVAAVEGSARFLANATGVEPPLSDATPVSVEPLVSAETEKADEVCPPLASSATQFEPPAFLVKQKTLRPDCLEPTNCAGYGTHTCHRCTVAARSSEVA